MSNLEQLKKEARESFEELDVGKISTVSRAWIDSLVDKVVDAVESNVFPDWRYTSLSCCKSIEEAFKEFRGVCDNFHSANEFCQGCGWTKEKHELAK